MSMYWSDEIKNAKSITCTKGYISCYRVSTDANDQNILNPHFVNVYSYRIAPGEPIAVSYDEEKNALLITRCNNPRAAMGKYIIEYTKDLKVINTFVNIYDPSAPIESSKPTEPSHSSEGTSFERDNTVTYIDDSFTKAKNIAYKSQEEYVNNLKDGLKIKDLRGILGAPHQFLPTTDPRIDTLYSIGDGDSFGRVYSEKIIKNIPLLLMTPGSPSFMTSFSEDQKNTIISAFVDTFKDKTEETLNNIFSGGHKGKYYSFKYAYTDYFKYVNAMLRSAAFFLEIQNETIDDKQTLGGDSKLGTTNWLYRTSNIDGDIYSTGNLVNFLGPYAGCIAFYADAGTTVDDSFSNSTTESSLSSMINGLSDRGRELNFLLGDVSGMTGVNLDWVNSGVNSAIDSIEETVDNILNKGNILSNILNKGQTILSGGRIVFPEIWSDSSFSRSYSCSMKLVSPSGDKLSVFLNILVPIYHLLAFTLPRETIDSSQTYYSPFLVRAYYKGLFNVDMGIISGLSITKGDEGEWTTDGIPTVANVSFEIKDLYDSLYMSEQSLTLNSGIMGNVAELDYIANSCGINVNDQEVFRTIKMYAALSFTSVKDKITIGIFGGIKQYFNQKVQDLFGVFK